MDGKEFSDYVANITASGYTCTLLALGHELGLFDLMMEENRPMTSHEIAASAKMKERYVREWLAGVVAGKFVSFDSSMETYHIPEAHRDTLRAQSAWACGILAIGTTKESVKHCFLKNGPEGVSFNNNETYWAWFGDWRTLTSDKYIQNEIMPALVHCGVSKLLESGVNVLDACCGSGDLTFALAALCPNSTFHGIDIAEKPLDRANCTVASRNITNAKFTKADIGKLPAELTGKFDVVTLLDAIHELPYPEQSLKELAKALTPDGVLVCTEYVPGTNLQDDVGKPSVAQTRAIILNHCMPSKLNINPNAENEQTWGSDYWMRTCNECFNITHCFEPKNNFLVMVCKPK